MAKTLIDIDALDNRQVIVGMRRGDEQLFDAVYRHYFRGLCAYATRFVHEDKAVEIVQDTMMWLWESRMSLNPDMSLKSLLFVIVKNKALNSVKHTYIKRRVHAQIIEKFEHEFDNPDLYIEKELFAKFSEALNKLPATYRQAFEMHRMDGLSHKEMAKELNISPKTVSYRIGQAMKMLRVELKDFLPLLLFLLHN